MVNPMFSQDNPQDENSIFPKICTEQEKENFRLLKEKADAGDVGSQITIGHLYETGEGVEKSPEKAFHYYKLAAKQKIPKAFFLLAECHAIGKGTPKSVEDAIHYYELAAQQGSSIALERLAFFLLKHKKDEKNAVEYLKKFILDPQHYQELVNYCEFHLGKCYENGIGVNRSNLNALHYYKLASDHGSEQAQERLGDAYLKAELEINKSPEQAIYYYKLAGDQGLSSALTMLGQCHERGEGVQQSDEKAFYYYKMAADIDMQEGYSSSILDLARCYKAGIGIKRSLENAIHYYKFAAENGYTAGYNEVAQCYINLGGKENEQRADAYFKMAKAGMKIDAEEDIEEMKNRYAFSRIYTGTFKRGAIVSSPAKEECKNKDTCSLENEKISESCSSSVIETLEKNIFSSKKANEIIFDNSNIGSTINIFELLFNGFEGLGRVASSASFQFSKPNGLIAVYIDEEISQFRNKSKKNENSFTIHCAFKNTENIAEIVASHRLAVLKYKDGNLQGIFLNPWLQIRLDVNNFIFFSKNKKGEEGAVVINNMPIWRLNMEQYKKIFTKFL